MYLFHYFLYYPVRDLFSQQLPRCFWMGASSKNSSLDFVWVGAAAPSLLGSSGWVSTPQSPAKLCVTHPSASLDGAGGPWLPKRSQPDPAAALGILQLCFPCWVTRWSVQLRALSLHFPCSLPAVEPSQHSWALWQTPGQVLPPEIQGEHIFYLRRHIKCICQGKIHLQGQKGKKRIALMGKESWGNSHCEGSENTTTSECYKPAEQIRSMCTRHSCRSPGARDRIHPEHGPPFLKINSKSCWLSSL